MNTLTVLQTRECKVNGKIKTVHQLKGNNGRQDIRYQFSGSKSVMNHNTFFGKKPMFMN